MVTKNITSKIVAGLAALAITIGAFIGCTDRNIPLETTSDVLISTYIENDTTTSDFYEILKATGYDGFLDAYGVYTCFAPTNAAIKAYAAQNGKTSWQDFTNEELKKMVSLHVINGYFKTSDFSDGKMAKATMAGEYLTSTVTLDANNIAQAKISADNISKSGIIKSNIDLGNGILHQIDKVLVPPVYNLSQIVENMRSQGFSIFADAMVNTGLSDTLSKVNIGTSDTLRRWFTILAESDEAFQANGISSYDALKAKYSSKGDPKDPTDSLYIFMAYRILKGINFLADFAKNDTSASGLDSYTTLVPSENTLIKRIPNSESIDVVLERDNFMKITKSLPIVRTQSDIKGTNGVFHAVNGHYKIVVKHATPIYWEITDVPEIMSKPLYKQVGAAYWFLNGAIAGSYYEGPYAPPSKGGSMGYQCLALNNTGSYPVIPTNGDWLTGSIRTAVLSVVSWPTPEINKGKYKIWLCYRSGGTKSNQAKVIFDDTITLPFKANFSYQLDLTKSESQMEAEGYKTYLAPAMNHKTYVGVYLGSVDLKSTKRHTIKFVAETNNTGPRDCYLDMIHFIPVDMDQIWPKFNQAGQMVTRQDAGL